MGEANDRGTYEERKLMAINQGRIKKMNNKEPVSTAIDEEGLFKCPNTVKAAFAADVEPHLCGCFMFDRVELIKPISSLDPSKEAGKFAIAALWRCVECGYLLIGKDHPKPPPVMAQMVKGV